MAIQVNQYQKIRMYYEQEHRSIRWIAKKVGISRSTVRKYIEGNCVPWERKPGSGRKSVITEEVDRFLTHALQRMNRRICQSRSTPQSASMTVSKRNWASRLENLQSVMS